jgi:thioredoxin-related protein
MRTALISALLALLLPASALPGTELLVIEQQDCPYCEKFDREIAEAYPKTTEGKKAPLRRLDLHQAWPKDLSNIRIERFTPTFVLVHEGQEVDRIRGYPGDIYFWFLLNEMLVQLEE